MTNHFDGPRSIRSRRRHAAGLSLGLFAALAGGAACNVAPQEETTARIEQD